MATPIGTNVVTALSRRYIIPTIVDNIYNSNPVFFRLNKGNKKQVRGGTQIEVPLMYSRFSAGGPYRGFDVLSVIPQDTIKNAAFDWKQHYTYVTVDGLTLVKTDSPEAIANFIKSYFAQAEMDMAANLGVGLWSNGVTNTKDIDGLAGAVDDGGVLDTYGGISRTTNTWWRSFEDATTATLTMASLQSFFGNVSKGGRHPTLFVSRQEQYNRFWALNIAQQRFMIQPMGHDEMLASAGFTNLLFNNVPWVVDDNTFDGPNASNSAIVALNEDYLYWIVSSRADFYVEDFQTPVDQDVMTAKMLWYGNLVLTNSARQGKMTNLTA